MIGLLTGTIEQKNINPVLVLVGGVGYNVSVPDGLRAALGNKETLFIHTHVSDSEISLFGFKLREDLMLFEMLLTVSGIGPRTALSILDRGAASIRKAISQSDVDFFTMIPRLGKKNAQKIIIELRSKLGSITELDLTETSGETKQIIAALESMGFARAEIADTLKHVKGESIEEKIRDALKYLGKK